MITYPSTQTSPQSLAQAPIPQSDQDRKRQMKDAWKAYRGEFPNPLKIEADKPNDNVKQNRCAPIVDKGVSFLFGQVLKIECDEQDFVDGFWGDDDDRMSLLSKVAMNGGVCGQTFIKLIPATGGMKYPRIVNLDPMLIRMVTDPEDCEVILAFIIEYPASGGIQKRQIVARIDPNSTVEVFGENDPDDTWTITNYQRRIQGGGFQNDWQQVGAVEEWEYPFPPIFTSQNLPNPNEPWGVPDLTPDLIESNKVLNFILSNTSRIIKYHGHPVTYATGVVSSQITVAVDDVLCLPSPDSKLDKLAAMDNFTGLLSVAAAVRTGMNEQSRVPAIALGTDEPKGNISGIALKQYYQPLIEKTTEKQRLSGRLIREVSRAALCLAGKISVDEYEDYEVNLHWQPLLPSDDIAAANEALILQQLGVSNDTIYSGLGLNADDEVEKSAKEDSKKMKLYSQGKGFPPVPQPPNQQQQVQPGQAPGIPGANAGQPGQQEGQQG